MVESTPLATSCVTLTEKSKSLSESLGSYPLAVFNPRTMRDPCCFSYCAPLFQVPSETPFDISSVPLEVKTAPVKTAPGKKAKEAAAAKGPAAAAAGADLYEKALNAIPEFASYGKLFKV